MLKLRDEMHTQVYRRQHEQLRRLLMEVSEHLLPFDAARCRTGLGRLETVLAFHLALEDNVLYPHLISHDDPQIRKIAAEYKLRMGRLAGDFRAFAQKWLREREVESAPYDFAIEYRAISQALMQRMEREDSTLYAFVDMAP